MENILIFVLGMVIGKLLTNLLVLGRTLLMIKNAEVQCLKMIGSAAQDISFIKEIKKRTIEQSGIDINDIKIQNNLDEHAMSVWKRAAINNLLADYPKSFRGNHKYNDWDSAMEYLTVACKNEIKK